MGTFPESELMSFSFKTDANRIIVIGQVECTRVCDHHDYKSKQSVAYLSIGCRVRQGCERHIRQRSTFSHSTHQTNPLPECCQEAHTLHSLPQAHLVSEHHMLPRLPRVVQPIEALQLVRVQLPTHQKRRRLSKTTHIAALVPVGGAACGGCLGDWLACTHCFDGVCRVGNGLGCFPGALVVAQLLPL